MSPHRSTLAAFSDAVDPPLSLAGATPLSFMEATSRGHRQRFRHLELIEQAVLEAIETGGRKIISVSVRHGKTELCSRYLPAWYIGNNPDKNVIEVTHEADFAGTHGLFARQLLEEYGQAIFGLDVSSTSSAARRWHIEGHTGGMLSLGVGGSPIGRGGDLVVVDDPYRNFEDAMSPYIRRKVKEWWTGTMESRIEPGGAVILIMARWHEDDLAGFLLREAPDEWTELRLPAICDGPDDPMGREVGEALWPERYPLPELNRRHKATALLLGEQVWLAQFQGTPRNPEGGLFPEQRWMFTDHLGWTVGHTTWCRAWDLAWTDGAGDWTVGALIGLVDDGRIVIGDVVRGQWGPDDMRAELLLRAQLDPPGTYILLPQDPAAGKDVASQLVRMLHGYNVEAKPHSDPKEVRAVGLSAQQRAYNVTLLAAEWNGLLVDECRAFPKGVNDDIVDAIAYGYNHLVDPIEYEELIEDDEEPVSISSY